MAGHRRRSASRSLATEHSTTARAGGLIAKMRPSGATMVGWSGTSATVAKPDVVRCPTRTSHPLMRLKLRTLSSTLSRAVNVEPWGARTATSLHCSGCRLPRENARTGEGCVCNTMKAWTHAWTHGPCDNESHATHRVTIRVVWVGVSRGPGYPPSCFQPNLCNN